MSFFVDKDSIVRKIWGKGDTILFIFAGAAGEFALNKEVDWLFFTGKLPSDPLGRMFSTVNYARRIIFMTMDDSLHAIDTIRKIHSEVEHKRGFSIPDWAYRDVLFMLIYYSIASFELLERKLSGEEKEEVYNVFYRVGKRMGLKKLPAHYIEWLPLRDSHLEEHLQKSDYTTNLFRQYRLHLGAVRYQVLTEAQKLVAPRSVKKLLGYRAISWLGPIIPVYQMSRYLKLDRWLKNLLLPIDYRAQIMDLDLQVA
jgi:hypothetical protein